MTVDFDVKGTTAAGQEIARRESVSDAPFLSGKWWLEFLNEHGGDGAASIVCEVMSVHKSHNGSYIAVELMEPSALELANTQGEVGEHEVVRIGNLAGFNLARRDVLKEQDHKFFVVGDILKITCTGVTEATKEGYSDSPNFSIAVKLSPSRKLKGGKF